MQNNYNNSGNNHQLQGAGMLGDTYVGYGLGGLL